MAHQDYVSQTPKGKRKPYASKNTVAAEPVLSLKAKLISLFTLVAISGFAYFLWTIKDSTPPPAIKKAPQVQEVALPPPPTEKWDYIDELADKKVAEGQYEVKQGGPYKLQCGSFRTQKQAEVLKANMGFSGFRAQMKASTSKSGTTWYKVFLGPYERKRAAEHDKNKLKRNNINHCKIWLWQ